MKQILIVEDDSATQALYTSLLKDQYKLKIAPSVERAIKLLAKNEFDLAIIDLSLAGVTYGLELIQYLRQEYQNKTIPILTITAHVLPEVQAEAIHMGSNEFFGKPLHPATLLEAINRLLV